MAPDALTNWVIVAGLAVGLAFGAVAHRTRFCTLGAVVDLVGMGDSTRLRMWALAIAVAAAGTSIAAAIGLIDLKATIYATPRLNWLAHIIGGAAFGIGMVLASGCGAKTLVRIGSGSLKALVAGIFLAIGALITLRGLLGLLRVNVLETASLDLPATQDLPSLLAASGLLPASSTARLALALMLALLIGTWALARPDARRKDALLGGAGVGLAVVAGWLVTGWLGFVPEHPETLEPAYLATNTGRMESLSLVAPQAYALDLLMFWTDSGRGMTFGIAAAAGTILGAMASAMLAREFRWEGFAGTADLVRHMAGGLLMGFGGITGLGCTIGQGVTGVSTFSIGSWLTLATMLASAWATLQWQYRRLDD